METATRMIANAIIVRVITVMTNGRKDVITIELERQTNETPLEHHRRIVYGKLVDKTLSDYDYSELAPYIYGKEYSADVARRLMYGSRMTLELLDAERESVKNFDAASDINNRMVALQKEQQRVKDQRREFNKLLRHEARYENLESALIAAANKLNESRPLFETFTPIGYESDPETEAVLVFCDWHYGMKTSNIFNEYNTDICKHRLETVVQAAVKRMALHRCSKLHIVVLGDLLHGAIHVGARVASEELVADQLMQVSELLAQAIEKLSACVDEVVVYMTYGNHGRTVQNKNDSIHRDNMERIVRWWLEQRMRDNTKVIIAPEEKHEFLFISAGGHDICASHGDIDNVKTSPRLFQTLFSKKYGKNVECVLLADKHHRESFDECGITSMICGALCGTDDFANDHRLYSQPEQLMLIVNERDGVDAEYRLKC